MHPLLLSLCVCVYVYLLVSVDVCTCVWRPEVDPVSFPNSARLTNQWPVWTQRLLSPGCRICRHATAVGFRPWAWTSELSSSRWQKRRLINHSCFSIACFFFPLQQSHSHSNLNKAVFSFTTSWNNYLKKPLLSAASESDPPASFCHSTWAPCHSVLFSVCSFPARLLVPENRVTDPSVVGQTYWHTDGARNPQAGSLVRKVKAEGILLYSPCTLLFHLGNNNSQNNACILQIRHQKLVPTVQKGRNLALIFAVLHSPINGPKLPVCGVRNSFSGIQQWWSCWAEHMREHWGIPTEVNPLPSNMSQEPSVLHSGCNQVPRKPDDLTSVLGIHSGRRKATPEGCPLSCPALVCTLTSPSLSHAHSYKN